MSRRARTTRCRSGSSATAAPVRCRSSPANAATSGSGQGTGHSRQCRGRARPALEPGGVDGASLIVGGQAAPRHGPALPLAGCALFSRIRKTQVLAEDALRTGSALRPPPTKCPGPPRRPGRASVRSAGPLAACLATRSRGRGRRWHRPRPGAGRQAPPRSARPHASGPESKELRTRGTRAWSPGSLPRSRPYEATRRPVPFDRGRFPGNRSSSPAQSAVITLELPLLPLSIEILRGLAFSATGTVRCSTPSL